MAFAHELFRDLVEHKKLKLKLFIYLFKINLDEHFQFLLHKEILMKLTSVHNGNKN